MTNEQASPGTRDAEVDAGTAPAGASSSRLREWFAAVADLDDAERAEWIAAHVADEEQRRLLYNLLAADAASSGYLATPIDEHLARLDGEDDARPSLLIGARIGAFRLTRSLGKGGMAEVFLGEREGGDFVQRVAVKILRRGLYSDVEQRLFRRERQLLAGLEHPNIARLIDGGLTGAGVPYLVIEFIDGEPITRYATDRSLDVRARVELFLVVCRAVEAAHRALIVHRDIKPSNILVASDGAVKLLDFGIAKLLEDEIENPTVGVFTPDYAAPEQLSGAPVTTATDVYALGVLLHELLLGARPQGSPTRRPSSLARAPLGRKDATVPNPAALPRALRGDLDTIILKCLAAEPDRRYASAGALADDVQRHLSGKPVEAHAPSRWYRINKFVRRHRGSVVVTVALVVAVLAGLAAALWQAKVARHEAARAREVQTFVESLFEPLTEGTAPEKEPTLQQLLQRGIDRIDGSFHEDLSAQAELLDMFSRIQDQLGEIKSNRDLSERAYRVTEQLYGPNDVRTLDTREKHARILYRLGEFDTALSELTAVRAAMQAGDIHGTSLAAVLEDTAFVRNAQGAKDEELIALNEAALKEREADAESTTENLATGYNNLALAYYRADQLDRTLELFNRAHDLFVEAKGESYVTATSLANIGGVQVRMGRWREGLSTQIEAREMFKRIGITEHQMLAQVLMGICDSEGQLQLYPQALAACSDAVVMSGKVLGESHPRFARALVLRATAEIHALNLDAATHDLDRARSIYAGMQGNAVPALRAVDIAAAGIDQMRGDYAQLRQHLVASVTAAKNPDASSAILLAWFALACERVPGQGCGNDDVTRARQALADPKFARNPDRLEVQNTLAQIDLAHGAANRAIEEIQQGLSASSAELGDRHSWVGEAHLLMGDARKALGDTAAAGREYSTALAILGALPSAHPLRLQAENRIAHPR